MTSIAFPPGVAGNGLPIGGQNSNTSGLSATQPTAPFKMLPKDFSDTGEAELLCQLHRDELVHCPSIGYLVYNGAYWDDNQAKARGIVHSLTSKQLAEAEAEVARCRQVMEANGAWRTFETSTLTRALKEFSAHQRASYDEYACAEEYRKFALQKRNSAGITATLREAQPMVNIDVDALDADPFALNTPAGTVDLTSGVMRQHNAKDFITKCTTVAPSDTGKDIWMDALNVFFCGDQALISYVQEIAGLMLIGKVFVECMILAVGCGRNGKSSFFNTLAHVMGKYAGTLAADTLTAGCRRNIKPELATAKGKRLMIAAELEEGERLNTSVIKTLASTDRIHAEPKYLAPFSFENSALTVLYTNHLPRVGAIDNGTWRRITVIPFSAVIDDKSDIKNFSDYLFANAGGAILSWMIEGAVRIIAQDYKLSVPQVVESATKQYRDDNDWLAEFLASCCEADPGHEEKAEEVYASYRNHAARIGEYIRSKQDFAAAVEGAGYVRHRTSKCMMVRGLRIKQAYRSY